MPYETMQHIDHQPASEAAEAAALAATAASANPQKQRTGLKRLWFATGYSLQGLRSGWQEKAFRQEVCAAAVLLPAACCVGQTWVETLLLAATVVAVMVVELLNSAVEAAIDRIGLAWHPLSKQAKDLGSAAVLLSVVLCVVAWTVALCAHAW